MSSTDTFDQLDEIAIIGMTCRFPGARNVDEFWQNLRDGVEAISFFSAQELEAAGIDPAVLSTSDYVKAKPVLEGVELFDASFFKVSPREAEILDPQHRLLLECAWEVLEGAGYDSETYAGRIGVYAGTEMSSYFTNNLLTNRERLALTSGLQVTLGVDRSYLSTRVSYELNLRGPSITVQTSCSTSLVAMHLACESLLNSECDMALVGAVTVQVPQKAGYFYKDGGIFSPDGHCRAFDARAQGTIFGSGIGIVVLKRLAGALADGDHIHAVIKGSAINNDGSLKVGYTAPSVDGQAAVIAEALTVAGVDTETVTYVEAHGTATELGDPIEIAALTQAFRRSTGKKGFCAIGAVKTNVGHLAAAAGMAGLIKTVLALKHKMIPPSLHFEHPNPKIDFANSPFYVNATLSEWQTGGVPRRAGVSSFGVGGTNAHVVLEEAPGVEASGEPRPWHLLVLSAKTDSALESASDNLVEHLKQHPDLSPTDVAYTLQIGRRTFSHRRVLAYRDLDDALTALETRDPKRVFTTFQEASERPVAFMFPGLGDQYPNMALGLYRTEPTFRAHVDHCCEFLKSHLGLDLREVIFVGNGQADESAQENETFSPAGSGLDLRKMLGREEQQVDPATQRLNQTSCAHPAVFVIEYALAQLLMEWGIRPQAMAGHSIGEYVAACLSGVFSLQHALTLVARRAQMIQALPGGAMLAVPLSEQQVQPLLGEQLSLSAINGPALCVLAGPVEAVTELERSLIEQGIACRPVQTSHAFHSRMLEPVLEPLTELVKTFDLKPPTIPYVSNLTGTWITPEQATDPHYWARHSRQPVRFADGVGELLKEPDCILLEVGPGHTLSSLAIQHPASNGAAERVLSTIRHSFERQPDMAFLLSALGQLWMAGVPVDWQAFYRQERRLRILLPTYPFERQRYWIEPGKITSVAPAAPAEQRSITDWFYVPSWKRAALPAREPREVAGRWLLFSDGESLSARLAHQLETQGGQVVTVLAGERFAANGNTYTVRPADHDDYKALLAALGERDQMPGKIVHLWNVASLDENGPGFTEKALQHSFYSLLFLAQAIDEQGFDAALQMTVVSSNMQKVASEEVLYPEKATLLGPCKVIPQEMPNITCRSIDVALPEAGPRQEAQLIEQIIAEIEAGAQDSTVAYRGHDRWVQTYEPRPLPEVKEAVGHTLREGGVYLITGGLSDLGLALAQHLARTVQAKLVLLTRFRLPDPAACEQELATRDPQDPIRLRIRAVQTLEALGAEVLVVRADVTNQSQMKAAVRAVCEQFGTIHGVIHAAGSSAGEMIQSETRESANGVLGPKVQGARVLEAVLRDVPLDFMVLSSSLAALVGGSGQVACCAANAFVDAFAHVRNTHNDTLTVSINWDTERDIDIAFNTAFDDAGSADGEPQPIAEVFQRILAHNRLPQVAVYTRHLPTLIEQPDELERPRDSKPKATGSEHPRPNLPTAYVTPRSDVEEKLAGIWQQLLGIGKVGRNDSFFRLGGHSLVALQLINRVRDTFQVEMPLRASFEAPTIAELAECIEGAREAAHGAPVTPIAPVSRDGELFVSFAQQWLLSHQLGSPSDSARRKPGGSPLRRLWQSVFERQAVKRMPELSDAAYNFVSTVRLSGTLDLAALEQSLNEIVRRHEILRTSFSAVDGRPVQVIVPAAEVTLPVVEDLRAISEVERESRLQQLVDEEVQRPFDLAQGPLWRAILLALSAEEHVLLLNMQRLVSDDRSVEIFVQEIAALYDGFCTAKPPSLPELPIQYADFAAWQWEWLPGEVLEAQLAYWKQQLGDGLPVLELAAGRPRPAAQASRRASQSFALAQELTAALKTLSQQENGTLFMTLLAAFKTLLHRYTGQTDVVVGTPVTNRNRSEIEGLVGLFGNTLALRTDLAGDPTFYELLRRVREVTLGAYAHQDLPFEMLVEELGRPPLFQVMFVLQNEPLETLALPGLILSDLKVDGRGAKFDLTLSIEDTEQGLKGALEYDASLFDAATIARLVNHFQTLLEGVVINPRRCLSDLLSAADEGPAAPLEHDEPPGETAENIAIQPVNEEEKEK